MLNRFSLGWSPRAGRSKKRSSRSVVCLGDVDVCVGAHLRHPPEAIGDGREDGIGDGGLRGPLDGAVAPKGAT